MDLPVDEFYYILSGIALVILGMVAICVAQAVREDGGRWIATGAVGIMMSVGMSSLPVVIERQNLSRETDAEGYDLVAKARGDCRIRPLVALASKDRVVNRGEVLTIRRRIHQLERSDARDRLNRTPAPPCRTA